MESRVVGQGIYAGIPYIVACKNGKLYVGLTGGLAAELAAAGANMRLLDDIGDKDPDDAVAEMIESLPEKKD